MLIKPRFLRSPRSLVTVSREEPDAVVELIAHETQSSNQMGESVDWSARPLSELISHILETHHAFTRSELNRLDALITRVCSVHSERHTELFRLQAAFQDLKSDPAASYDEGGACSLPLHCWPGRIVAESN